MRILIAEDETSSRFLLETTLRKWGYETVTTTDGLQAWEILQQSDAPPIAILDWMMPGMDGTEICRRLRERENHPYTYVILLTALNGKEDLAAGLEAGADDYMGKPFNRNELHSRIRVGERIIATEQKLAQQVIEYQQVETALRAAHAETTSLLDAIQSILIALDSNGRIVHWNQSAQRILGLSDAEVVGKLLDECAIPWDFPFPLKHLATTLTQTASFVLRDVPLQHLGGKEAILGFSAYLFRREPEAPPGLLLFGADITERRAAERQLRQAQKMESIGQLAAGIAHEINTPTQYIGNNTRFLQEAFLDLTALLEKYAELLAACQTQTVTPQLLAEVEALAQQADVEYFHREMPLVLQQTLEGIDRIASIVQSMKFFAHPGSAEKVPADLNQAIANTIAIARNEWKYTAEMVTEFDETLPPVPCLLGELNQVLLNLIINATHAIADVVGTNTGAKGTITISTRHEANEVVIRVQDTGKGIPEEIRARIFDPFFTTKEVGRGTGQGLAISHAVIVEKHGGSIHFESKVGHGTTFIIRLPLQPSVQTAMV